jgi:hypothetical protein
MLPVALDVAPVNSNQAIAALLARLESTKLQTIRSPVTTVRLVSRLALVRLSRPVPIARLANGPRLVHLASPAMQEDRHPRELAKVLMAIVQLFVEQARIL